MKEAARKTVLIVGEGGEDRAFLKHICCLFDERNSGIKNTIRNAAGGSPWSVVNHTRKIRADYNLKVAVIDGDQPESDLERARQLARAEHIQIIEVEQCMECMLLKILNPDVSYQQYNTQDCKDYFERHYINSRARRDHRAYAEFFSKGVLEDARNRIPELGEIIDAMTEI